MLKEQIKRNKLIKFIIFLIAIGIGLYLRSYIIRVNPYIFNITNSVPRGIYKKIPYDVMKNGDYVTFCPNNEKRFKIGFDRGYILEGSCPNGMEPLLKILAAQENDKIDTTPEGIMINNHLFPNSKAIDHDSRNRTLQAYQYHHYKLKKDELLLLGTNKKSFDSRYFGLINKKDISFVVEPIYTIN